MATTDKWTPIHTTLPHPLPPCTARPAILTPRLLIRPLAVTDLTALHTLMTQPEVMQWTAAGRAHTDLVETERKLSGFVTPQGDESSYNFAICLREGELVGIGGVVRLNRFERGKGEGDGDGLEGGYGWPELGYLLKREVWGRGFATEFVRAFLGMWDGLRRGEVEMEVNEKSLDNVSGQSEEGQGVRAKEVLVAIIDPRNAASRRVLEKCGFEHFDDFTEKHREEPDKSLELLSFRYFPKDGGQG